MQYGHGLPAIGSGIAHRPQQGSASSASNSAAQSAQSGPAPSNPARQTAQLHGKTKSIKECKRAPIGTAEV
jgi:hypothetical protein